jgi:Tol biopolymer transport system component
MIAGMTVEHIRNVFIYDQQTGASTLVSHQFDSTNTGGDFGNSENPVISKDGNYVVYQSSAHNLIDGGSYVYNDFQIILYGRLTGSNTLVTHANDSATTAGDLGSNIRNRSPGPRKATLMDGTLTFWGVCRRAVKHRLSRTG